MKKNLSMRWAGLSASLILVSALVGCHQKTDAKSELDAAARTMQKAEPPPAPASQPQPSAPAGSPAQQMNRAVAAYKGGQVTEAVVQLQKLRATPTLTPEQRMALNDAMAAVMSEISARAAKGDPGATEALQQYEKLQTQRQ